MLMFIIMMSVKNSNSTVHLWILSLFCCVMKHQSKQGWCDAGSDNISLAGKNFIVTQKISPCAQSSQYIGDCYITVNRNTMSFLQLAKTLKNQFDPVTNKTSTNTNLPIHIPLQANPSSHIYVSKTQHHIVAC